MASLISKIRKEQIIKTVIEIIAQDGSVSASINEIAKRAKVSRGVITYYFKSKDTLIDGVMFHIISDIIRYVSKELKSAETPAERILIYVRATFDYWGQNEQNFRAVVDLWRMLMSSNRNRVFNRMAIERIQKYLTEVLEEGNAAGDFQVKNPELYAFTLQSEMDGCMMYWNVTGQNLKLTDIRDSVLNTVKMTLQISDDA